MQQHKVLHRTPLAETPCPLLAHMELRSLGLRRYRRVAAVSYYIHPDPVDAPDAAGSHADRGDTG